MKFVVGIFAVLSYTAALASTFWSIQQVLYVVSLPNSLEQVSGDDFRLESLSLLWTEAVFYILGMVGLLILGGYGIWLLLRIK